VKGDTGLTGAAGAQGPKGDTGDTGAASTVPGPAGPQGPQGLKGDTGAASTVPGPAGPQGPIGNTGPQGAAGPQGPQGAQGATGASPGISGTRVFRSTAQSIPASTATAISFDTERYDLDNVWVVGAPTRFTIAKAGMYQLSGHLTFAASTSGTTRLARIMLNGTTVLAEAGMVGATLASVAVQVNVATVQQLAVGDYVELQAYHTATAALNVGPSTSTTNRDGADFSIGLVGAPDLAPYQLRSEKNLPSGYVGLDASSKIVLGGDTNLYRAAAATLRTDGIFNVAKAAADAQPQITLQPDFAGAGLPALVLGPGGASGEDTWIYRAGGGAMATSGDFYVAALLASQGVIANRGGANLINLSNDGRIYFGSAADTWLFRAAAGILQTNGQFNSAQSASGASAFMATSLAANGYCAAFQQAGDTNWRFLLDANGAMTWGPGGTTPGDVTLYRGQANQLYTNGSMQVAGGLVVDQSSGGNALYFGGALDTYLQRTAAGVLAVGQQFTAPQGLATKQKAGAPLDGDWAAPPPNGMLVVDSTNNKLWARVNGVWKGVVIA
jgi:hypothetical protein